MIIINGSTEAIRKRLRYSFDPARGLTVTEDFESAGDNLAGLARTARDQGQAFEWTANPRLSTLALSTTGENSGAGVEDDEDLVTYNWQLMANEIQKDIREHPVALLLEANFPGSLQKIVADIRDDVDVYAEDFYIDTVGALEIYSLLVRGTTHYALGQYVLRRTISMPNDSNFNFSDAGANQIFSTASILGLVMPPVIESVIGIISAPAFRADYFWGWLRKPSNYTTSGNNRVDVSTEWWLEQWSTILYSLG